MKNQTGYTCQKTYSDLPAAHRQHLHSGHCAFVHGHDWGFTITFGCDRLDSNGFVVDFGRVKYIKEWLDGMFDHTLLINEDDPELGRVFEALADLRLVDLRVVPNCGAEGLARFVFRHVQDLLLQNEGEANTKGRGLRVVSVTCSEDSKNAATYQGGSDE
jgi:6-pyruvoyltetrahydropterin/6-carboxytetrahydropterin synthase